MTKRIIIDIEKCDPCPHLEHTGALTEGGSKPCCNHPITVKERGNNCFKRVIPYKITDNLNWKVKMIPKWCPLSDKK